MMEKRVRVAFSLYVHRESTKRFGEKLRKTKIAWHEEWRWHKNRMKKSKYDKTVRFSVSHRSRRVFSFIFSISFFIVFLFFPTSLNNRREKKAETFRARPTHEGNFSQGFTKMGSGSGKCGCYIQLPSLMHQLKTLVLSAAWHKLVQRSKNILNTCTLYSLKSPSFLANWVKA
jgi:hypothetical protein